MIKINWTNLGNVLHGEIPNLEAPYNMFELEDYYNRGSPTLPEFFEYYLTNISRNIINSDGSTYLFELSSLPKIKNKDGSAYLVYNFRVIYFANEYIKNNNFTNGSIINTLFDIKTYKDKFDLDLHTHNKRKANQLFLSYLIELIEGIQNPKNVNPFHIFAPSVAS